MLSPRPLERSEVPITSTPALFRQSRFSDSLKALREEYLGGQKAPKLRRLGRKQIRVDGVDYDSLAEIACVKAMQKYIPGFKVKPGENFQIPMSKRREADFIVNGVVVEYHPVRTYYDFRDRKKYREYLAEVKKLRGAEKEAFKKKTERNLANSYRQRRKRMIAETPEHVGKELIVAKSSAEFYDKVIKRFGQNYPSKGEFVRDFEAVIQSHKAQLPPRYKQSKNKKKKGS